VHVMDGQVTEFDEEPRLRTPAHGANAELAVV